MPRAANVLSSVLLSTVKSREFSSCSVFHCKITSVPARVAVKLLMMTGRGMVVREWAEKLEVAPDIAKLVIRPWLPDGELSSAVVRLELLPPLTPISKLNWPTRPDSVPESVLSILVRILAAERCVFQM